MDIIPTLVKIYRASIKGFKKNDFKKPQGLIKALFFNAEKKKNKETQLSVSFPGESPTGSRCYTTEQHEPGADRVRSGAVTSSREMST